MSFKVSLNLDPAVLRSRVTSSHPIFLQRSEIAGKEGVLAMVRHSASREAYFYPRTVVEEQIEARGGRSGYVYHEGFDAEKTARDLAPLIRFELPKWQLELKGPMRVDLAKLAIGQPGVDLWRMLCFALDHGPGLENTGSSAKFLEQSPPSFAVWTVSHGPVLQAGNHRALFASIFWFTDLNLTWIHVPSRAVGFNAAISLAISEVEKKFGGFGIPALAKSFVRQVEAIG